MLSIVTKYLMFCVSEKYFEFRTYQARSCVSYTWLYSDMLFVLHVSDFQVQDSRQDFP
jgi:hypothetical protein